MRNLKEAAARIDKADVTDTRRRQLLELTRHQMVAPPDEAISTVQLAGLGGLEGRQLTKALADLETLGIARNDTVVIVHLHAGVADDSLKRLKQASDLETDLIALMREAALDAEGRMRPCQPALQWCDEQGGLW